MVKQIIIGGLIVAILVIGGVLEVKVHPEQLSQVPGRVMTFVGKPETASMARALVTDLKRRGEQLIIRDEAKRTELALLYVEQDAKRLDELTKEETTGAEVVLPQAELLQKSMLRLQAQLDKAPVDTLVTLRTKSRETLETAQHVLGTLEKQRERYAVLQERFATVTEAIKASLAALGKSGGEAEVAGTRDEAEATTTPKPSAESNINAIPLNF